MLKKLFAVVLCLAPAMPAKLLRIELAERSDVLAGKSFGSVGPYERLVGKAFFAVDPKLPANQIVCDIDKAPRNDSGLVEFSSDIYVLKPRDPKNGNGAVLYEVSNRGNKGMLAMFNRATASLNPKMPADFGDNFLLERGYTLIWLGWQFDVPRTEGLMRLYTPIARNGDRPITGLVRSEILVDKKEFSRSLADRNTHIPYPMADPNDPTLTLTVRDRNDGPRHTVPRSAWKVVEGTHISMDAGFEPGRIYEIVYTAKDPALVGLGPAAIRDLISFLKYGNGDNAISLADQRRFVKRAYAMGTSQSGRFLRTFLYYGFNADEQGRKMFDGVMAHVAGAGRGSFNIRFGQPSRDGHPFLNLFYPTDIFPFTDIEQTDPDTGLTDGLLLKAGQAHVTPKIFYTDSAYEYWGRAASLIHTTIDGKKDAPIPATTRIYFFAGGQHGPAAFPPVRTVTKNLPNPNPYTWSMRALLVAMDQWVANNVEPPPSQYPKIADNKLVELSALQFPSIPGVAVPTRPQRAYRVDYGPEFRSLGVISIEPPKIGKPFPILVPQVDTDGNETSGVRMPDIQVPLGTYAGWNLRAPEIGAPEEMYSMVGSYIPFARTRADRESRQDPRRSIEERYKSREDYLKQLESAAKSLVAGGYLLAQDVPKLVERGAAEWERR
jgi:alpha/beta hydrolase family protein